MSNLSGNNCGICSHSLQCSKDFPYIVCKRPKEYTPEQEENSRLKEELKCSRASYDHLSNEYRKLNNSLTELNKENNLLARKLFNSEQHYELLKQSYDNVFAYLAETNNSTTFLEFNKFMEWIRKPTPEIDKDIEDESVSAYELFIKKNHTKKEEK